MNSTSQSVDVAWTCQHPPVLAKSWYQWPTRSLTAHPLEKRLKWPQGVMSILEDAFQQKLSRYCAWNLDHVIDPKPYQLAASIYKRGVATSLDSVASTRGAYPLCLEPPHFKPSDWQNDSQHMLIDFNVAELWNISANSRTHLFSISEQEKDLSSVATIAETIESHPPESSYILVGGGVFCDTAAFAVSLLNRPFTLVPTTLLAMVDACVGGKTGVNFSPYGKNQIGLFSFPQRVSIWPRWLETLELRDFKAGLAESYKHALLSGQEELLSLFRRPVQIADIEPVLLDLIRIKAKIVAEDPGESGVRASLNLGHTLAHALEAISHKRGKKTLLHGEAVALGLVFQGLLGESLSYLRKDKLEEITRTLRLLGSLPSKQDLRLFLGVEDLGEPFLWQGITQAIQHDKKNYDTDLSQWVLLQDFGQVVQTKKGTFTVGVKEEALRDQFQRLLEVLD